MNSVVRDDKRIELDDNALDYLVKIEQENYKLKEAIDKAQELIRNENSLNETEIDELSEILDGYRN